MVQAAATAMKAKLLALARRSHVASLLLGLQAVVLPVGSHSAPVEQVVIVFKTHFDIGYTDMASNVVKRYRSTMIDDALQVVDQNRNLPAEQQFVWTIPGWPLSKIMEDWPGQSTQRQARVRQAFKDGRFVVHALPFTTHTESIEPEDLVRGLGFASRLSRGVGLELPRDAKMTDVPCHSWILPTLLKHAGVDFLHLGCNAASSSPRVPRLFLWGGPDDSRLLTMYTAESYGTGLVPPRDWPYRTWLALIHTGDNHGPPTPDEVKKLLAEAKQKLPDVKVRIGRLSDFGDAILAEKADIPVVRGDMPDTWIHGPMSDPQGAKLARSIRPAIATVESLNTMLRFWGVDVPDAAPTIAQAYEQSLLYGEHTWGGAQYWVTQYGAGTKWNYGDKWMNDRINGRFQRLEDSWSEHTAYIEKADAVLFPIVGRDLRLLAQSVRADGPRVTVFNPLPFRRSGIVYFEPPTTLTSFLRPADGGEAQPVWREVNGAPRFFAKDIPPLGYRTFVPVKAEAVAPKVSVDEKTATVQSPFFKAVMDPARGAIKSLVDKRSGHELIDASAAHSFGQYLYERFDSNNVAAYVKSYVKIPADWAINELGKPSMPPVKEAAYRAVTAAKCRLSVEFNSLFATARMTRDAGAGLSHGVVTTLRLFADQPVVELEITLQNKPADPWPEAGWLCLPFKIDSPRFRLGRQASIIDPLTDIVTGANRNLFGIHTGVAMFDPSGRGVGFCALDDPLVSLDEPGCWKYSLNFVPKKPVACINLFNNQWTTNFRMWNEGSWSTRVRIWSFDKYNPESSLITPSLESRYPLRAAIGSGPAGKLAPTREGLHLSRKGILVTAFGANPDGPGTVLRLWEMAGQSGAVTVMLPPECKAAHVQPVNLRGVPQGKPIAVSDGKFSFDLVRYAPASFVLGE